MLRKILASLVLLTTFFVGNVSVYEASDVYDSIRSEYVHDQRAFSILGLRKADAATSLLRLDAANTPTADLNFATGLAYGCTFTSCLSISNPLTGGTVRYCTDSVGVLHSIAPNTLAICSGTGLQIYSNTNLAFPSQGSFSAWSGTNITATDAAIAAPDGSLTASTLNDGAVASAQHAIGLPNAVSFTSGTSYTATFYAKQNTASLIQMTFTLSAFSGGGFANFDLAAGTVSATGGTLVSSSITALANGWYRCSMTAAATATVASGFTIYRINTGVAGRAPSYTGTNTLVDIYGAQIEPASFPGPYIPTTTAAVTSTDNVTATGVLATLLSSTTGYAFSYKLSIPSILNLAAVNNYVMSSSDGTSNNRISSFIVASSTNGSFRHVVGGVATNPADQGAYTPGSSHNMGRSVSSSVDTTYFDGIAGSPFTQTAMPVVNQVHIGSNEAGTAAFYDGTIKRGTFWNSAVNLAGVNP